VLPLGISFYIFQSLSYIIDVYRRKQVAVAGLLDFAAFVTFFPHLIAGPIQRVQQLVPQILKPDAITVTRIGSGVFLFSVGFLRKSFADLLATFHDPVFNGLDKAAPVAVVTAVFSFGFQIYLDFAGYSEMAVGLARVLGIDLIDNFQAPYLSTSFREFWRRWHISLSMWLRDYLYISLGGSREGLARQAANLVFTMTVCGLWHGAGWNFVLWGFLHGCYLAINILFNRVIGDRIPRVAGGVAGWVITFVVANYTWLYFRLPTMEAAMAANRKIGEWIAHPVLPRIVPPGLFLVVAAVFAMDAYQRFRNGFVPIGLELTTFRAVRYGLATGALLVAGLILNLGQPTLQFIYFQF
jgi:D-alanyl-lipoteichoic acid acyltransferase DltB (MBOAT superfamily)